MALFHYSTFPACKLEDFNFNENCPVKKGFWMKSSFKVFHSWVLKLVDLPV